MNKSISNYYGVSLLMVALVFTFIYSFWTRTNLLCGDQIYYLDMIINSDYKTYPMQSGTIWLYKVFIPIIGTEKLWLWQKLNWLILSATVLIPYFSLLDSGQRKRFAIVAAFGLLAVNDIVSTSSRPLILLCDSVFLTCFYRYLQSKRFGWLLSTSVVMSLAAFVRFPNILMWPVMIVATIIVNRNWKHILVAIFVPIIAFSLFATLANGGVGEYFNCLASSIERTSGEATGRHSFRSLLSGYIHNGIRIIAYIIVLLSCYCLYSRNLRKNTIPSYLMAAISLLAISAFFYLVYAWTLFRGNDFYITWESGLLISGIVISVLLLNIWHNKFRSQSIAWGIALISCALVNCAGSDGGLSDADEILVCFLPLALRDTPKLMGQRKKYLTAGGLLLISLFILYIRLSLTGFFPSAEKKCTDAGVVSPKLSHVYMDDNVVKVLRHIVHDAEYISNNKTFLFWGTSARVLNYLTDTKVEIQDFWQNDENANALGQLKQLVAKKRPILFDCEKSKALPAFMKQHGYNSEHNEGYILYYPTK